MDELCLFFIWECEIYDFFMSGMGNMKKFVSMQIDFLGSEVFLWIVGVGNLDKYCMDKIVFVVDKKVYFIVCCDCEICMMMEILGWMGKFNVFIIGDVGVGKIVLVDGLVCSIIEGIVF